MKISADVRSSAKRRVTTAKASDNQDELLEAMTRTLSEDNQRQFKMPRKFQKGPKSMGLLQNTPPGRSFSKKPWRRPSNPSTSKTTTTITSTTTSEEAQPSTSGEKAGSRRNPALYRSLKGYHLENFEIILNTVLQQPEDKKMLNNEDMELITRFNTLTLPSRKLFMCLLQRKVKWHRHDKINYENICDTDELEALTAELNSAGFLIQGKLIS